MKILEKQFQGKGSQINYEFVQLHREGKFAIYGKHGDGSYYEVIIIREQAYRESIVGGQKVTFEAKEIYPTDNDFGTYGWTTRTYKRALAIYENLILENEINNQAS